MSTSSRSADRYRSELAAAENQRTYLLQHSGLPGPRGNLELAAVAADCCPRPQLREWAGLSPTEAPTGTAEEYLAFCGVLGLRNLLAGEKHVAALGELRRHASDPRWRLREAVAMALQSWGKQDFPALAKAMRDWANGSWLERRAAAAALCEPALLASSDRVLATLAVLEAATSPVETAGKDQRRSEAYLALRKGLGYCWSVAAAANPSIGIPAIERLVDRAVQVGDRDLC